ncbi:WXG100 family type VII secretion target [Nocardia testacea]|uniref:WXG100 family type VII secretion target n=1 Tax=Nocardia testacea TaxID=248551 RepID=UPI003C2CC898
MATQGIDLDIDLVKAATGDAYQNIENVQQSIRAIDNAGDAARAGWKGDAQSSFAVAQGDWSDEAERLRRKLDNLATTLKDAASAILEMDSDAVISAGVSTAPSSPLTTL